MTIRPALFLSALILFFSCKSSENTIVTVDQEKTTTPEFQYVYEKNHAKDHDRYSRESLDQYLDLYINYRLKVIEAQAQKLDSSDSFETELNGYKKQLAKPYLTDNTVNENLAKEAYDRSKVAIQAQHILIQVEETASAADTLAAYNKIKSIKDSIVGGADFSAMAVKYSEDPSAKRPKGQPGSEGNLGYFSTLKMVYPFESAAYNTEKGNVSNIVRTKFGYHIIKVTDKIDINYEVEVAHIMINAPNGISQDDSTAKKAKVDFIYQTLRDGGNWDIICKENSEHGKTKDNGGQLDPFTLGGSLGLPAFELAAYDLKQPGDISEPIHTPYGWHIIKLIDKIPFAQFEDVKEDYVKKITRDERSQNSNVALLNRLKKDNNFKEIKNIKEVLATAKVNENSNTFFTENLNQELFKIKDKSYNLYSFNQYVETNIDALKEGADDYKISKLYADFVSVSLIEYEESLLESKYEEYRMLVKEFHDGILIYDLMKKEVWDKANSDTVALKKYYEEHKKQFKEDKYIIASIYTINDIKIIPDVKKSLESGLSKDSILIKYNKGNTPLVSVTSGKYKKGKNHIIDAANWNMDLKYEIHEIDGTDYIIAKEEVHTDDYLSFDQVRGKVVSQYQKQLEAEFIASLKSKYSVNVNQDEYQSLIKY